MFKYISGVFLLLVLEKICAAEVVAEIDGVEVPRELVVCSYGFNCEASAQLQELLKISKPDHIRACIQATNKSAEVYPFAPAQHIFFGIWCQLHLQLLRRLFLH